MFKGNGWLYVTPFSTFQLYHGGQCTYPCFSGAFLTSTPNNILSKPLAAFPHNHCRNNKQWNYLIFKILLTAMEWNF